MNATLLQPTWAVTQRWGSELTKAGWTPISTFFLEHYSELIPPITTSEAMFIIQLMAFKWDERPPFPAFKTIALRMGITTAAARAHARKLEAKQYLRRTIRPDNTNLFYLEPLIEALERFKEIERKVPKLEDRHQMSTKFRILVDVDFNRRIIDGIERRQSDVSFTRAQDVGLGNADDADLLEWGNNNDLILLSHDENTMTAAASERVKSGLRTPGVFIVSQSVPIGEAIAGILQVIESTNPGEWENVITFLPIR